MRIAPSLIAADFTRLALELQRVRDAGADLIHLDVMDGVFVSNLTFGPMIVEAVDRMTALEIDAHLMITRPERYLAQYLDAGVDWLSFHAEATSDPRACIEFVRGRRRKVGLALNPATPLDAILPHVPDLDYVLVMSVVPGFYGQSFMPEVVPKIQQLRTLIDRAGYRCLIEVDGGINDATAATVSAAGADIAVAGAAVFKQSDYAAAIARLRCSRD